MDRVKFVVFKLRLAINITSNERNIKDKKNGKGVSVVLTYYGEP